MIKNILKLFQSETPSALNTDDTQIALAALMVRLAKTDGEYALIEMTMIDRVLLKRFDLSDDAAQELRKSAEELESNAPDTVRFTRVIKETVIYEERAGVIEALWSIVLADGNHDDEEHGLMRLVANLLGVNDRDSAFARQRAQKQI